MIVRVRQFAHASFKGVAFVVIMFGLVFAPWESSLFGSESSMLGTSAAEAQQQRSSGYFDGTNATQCNAATFPSADRVSESDDKLACILRWEACPQSPVDPARLLTRSSEYLDMCEEEQFVYYQNTSSADYDKCVGFFDDNQNKNDGSARSNPVPGHLGGYNPDPDNMDGTVDGVCRISLFISDIDLTAYRACTRTNGVAVIDHTYDDSDPNTPPAKDNTCRIVAPAGCPSEIGGEAVTLNRVGGNSCEMHVRRTWECSQGGTQTNNFNTCYIRPGGGSNTNPACGVGAPDFGGEDCDAFVGDDATEDPECKSNDPVDPYYMDGAKLNLLQVTSAMQLYPYNEYWCIYDTRWLRLDCHQSSSTTCPNTESLKLCLKRTSKIGGCHAVAAAVKCRDVQADIIDGIRSSTDAYDQYCTPCVVLPFSDSPTRRLSNSCPESYHVGLAVPTDPHDQVLQTALDMHEAGIIDISDDFEADDANCEAVVNHVSDPNNSPAYTTSELDNCKQTPKCMDPPRGRLTWKSTHSTQVALAGADVIVSLADMPHTADADAIDAAFVEFNKAQVQEGDWRSAYLRLDDGAGGFTAADYWGPLVPLVQIGQASDRYGNPLHVYRHRFGAGHRDGTLGHNADEIVRSSNEPDQTRSYTSVGGMTGGWQCALKQRPHFRLSAQPLWPDLDEAEIRELFGDDSLDWWSKLGDDEKAAFSRANGFMYVDLATTSTADRIAEQRRRQSAPMAESVPCSWSDLIWCRWSPRQRGYYRLEATGAWLMHRSQIERLDTSYIGSNVDVMMQYGLGHINGRPPHVGQLCKPTTTPSSPQDDWYVEETGNTTGGGDPIVKWGDSKWGPVDLGARAFPDCFTARVCRWLIPGYEPLESLDPANSPVVDDCMMNPPDAMRLAEYGLVPDNRTDSGSTSRYIPIAGVRASFGSGTSGTSGTSGYYGDLEDDPDNLYRFDTSNNDGTKFRCPSIDARVTCTKGMKTTTNVNLTKTAPIGVIVYEARIDSRPAS